VVEQPAGRFRQEGEGEDQDDRGREADVERDLVGQTGKHGVGAVVDDEADGGADGDPRGDEAEAQAAEVGGR